MRAYIDADILIWHLRGNKKATLFLESLQASPEYDLWTGAMQRAEVVFFMRDQEESDTMAFLAQFNTCPVDQSVVDQAGLIYRRWHPSHGVDPNDAILAATVMLTGGKIYCLNTKHYPMPDILVEKAWIIS